MTDARPPLDSRPAAAPLRLALVLVVLVALLLAASTWRVYGHTWDEPEHLAAGMELLDKGKYEYDIQHPPLARVLIALGPYLAGARSVGAPPPDGTPEGVAILYGGGHYDLYLTLARCGTLPFLALLLVATWLWARRACGSDREALLAVVLLASVPPVLGHAALATLDVPAAATTLLALYWFKCWLRSKRRRDAAVLGLTSGIAVATKLSAIPFIGLGALALSLPRLVRAVRRAPTPAEVVRHTAAMAARHVVAVSIAAAVAAACIALVYGGGFVYLTDSAHRFSPTLSFLFGDDGLGHRIAYGIGAHVPVPAALRTFVGGIRAVLWHNSTGHLSYLLGNLSTRGWWYFYLVALAAKTPIALLLTGPVGMGVLAREGVRTADPWRLAPATLFLVILGFASLYSHINIGIRHVLILYPFLAIGASHLIALAWRRARDLRNRDLAGAACAVVVGLVGWQVSTLVTAHPDYLPYFNEAVPHPEAVLVDSDLAWGQDLRRLETRLAELKVPSFAFAYLGTADLTRETFPKLTRLAPGRAVAGWVAITALARVHGAAGYAWLDAYSPVERVGKSIDLYYIPEDPSSQAAGPLTP
ncbi:MAG: glycosyltransferase family 39 protein [Proteobacteria bacterium]|nr:glycosyltransferase family 39 protein [Pseudomonadota bacterium]